MRCDRRGHLIMVGDAVGEATREAPARTEPRTYLSRGFQRYPALRLLPRELGEIDTGSQELTH